MAHDDYWYWPCRGCPFATGSHWHLFKLTEESIVERILQQAPSGSWVAWTPE